MDVNKRETAGASEHPAGGPPAVLRPGPGGLPAAGERLKVLVIDDERGPRESLRFLLKAAYDVTCADNVDAGVEAFKRDKPDLVILDIRMPGKTGIQGLRELRALDALTSVVMLTGFGALETAQEALRLGANDYISKPFDTTTMLNLVNRFTMRSHMERKRVRMLKELQDMNSRLVEDLAAKDRLAALGQTSAEFAHDLRNPLMIVMGYINLLDQQLDKARVMLGGEFEQTADYLEVIEKNLRRCYDLAQLWQNADKTGLGQFAPVPVAKLVEDLVMSVEPLVSAVDVKMEYEVDDGGAVVQGSHAQLVRAIHNLISNAIDAVTPGLGRIMLSCERKGAFIEIRIADNGCGMPPDVLARMFEPYYTTKPKGKGTGLGTVIARRIVEEHQGLIDVQSTVGQGTVMSVLLPVKPVV
ncbi:MAG: hybrid sensor histidine kinase/response regulator [Lentisphaerae bacterium]|nr:hybrid sensor histidine kinase/response regulator [Lentisphaerota bacterium]